ncbi:MAG TPA: hypothetical protein VFU22_21390 [Roseiflexaceae bacterium]|nr:hypothetical protein [Roseiflexaceae bacterium]
MVHSWRAAGGSTIVDVMRQHMQMDEALNAALAEVERGPWFRAIAAGIR